jgi:CRP/FNR family transcriptional regulator, cyclic AMP receptor protein
MADSSIDFRLLEKLSFDIRRHLAGEAIFQKGGVGFEMFFVKQGEIELRLGERVLATLARGDIFGEMALVDDSTRSASAVALSDAEIVPVSEKQFVELVREAPSFAIDVMRVLAQRLRSETKRA